MKNSKDAFPGMIIIFNYSKNVEDVEIFTDNEDSAEHVINKIPSMKIAFRELKHSLSIVSIHGTRVRKNPDAPVEEPIDPPPTNEPTKGKIKITIVDGQDFFTNEEELEKFRIPDKYVAAVIIQDDNAIIIPPA